MNDISTQHERQEILKAIQKFVERVVAPRADELDQQPNPEDCFSWEIVEQASEAGIRTLTLSEEY